MKSAVLERPVEKKQEKNPSGEKKNRETVLVQGKRENLTRREKKDRERNMEVVRGGIRNGQKMKG